MEWNIWKHGMEYLKHWMEYIKHGMEYIKKHGMGYIKKHGMEYVYVYCGFLKFLYKHRDNWIYSTML